MNKVLFKNGQVFYHDQLQALDVLVEGDLIKAIEPSIEDQEASVIDLNGKLLSPGFIDIHTHLREPGFEYKETVLTGTKSALYGGYSTIVAMANTKPCMDDIETIERLENIIKKDACVHTYTYSAITTDLAGKELVDMEANQTNNIVVGFSELALQ